MKTLAYRLNPAVDKKFLILLAGAVWCGVGIMLILFAVSWLTDYQGKRKVFILPRRFSCCNANTSFRISETCEQKPAPPDAIY